VIDEPLARQLASASLADATVRVWDVNSGQKLLTLEGHRDAVWSVAFSPNRHRLASGSEDGTVKVWDATTGQELLTLKGDHLAWITRGALAVAFSRDGQRLASEWSGGTVKVWDAPVSDARRTKRDALNLIIRFL